MSREIPDYRKQFGARHDSAFGATQDKWEFVLKLYARHHGINFPMSARPWAGICVQHGVDVYLGLADYTPVIGQEDQADITEAIRSAVCKYQDYTPRNWDGDKDMEEYHAFMDHIPEMVKVGAEAVRQRFSHANMMEGEYQRWHNEPKIDVPIMLYQDYSGGGIQADLKCSLPLRNPPKKDGTRSWRVPKPRTEPTWQQVVQQSIYWKATGEMPSLLFVTASGYHIADSQNCEALTEDSLERAYNEAVRSWSVSQNLLRAANGSWRDLAGLVQPDFNEIARRHGPTIVDLAKQLWSF